MAIKYVRAIVLASVALCTQATMTTAALARPSACMVEAERYADSTGLPKYSDAWWQAYDEKKQQCTVRVCGHDENGNYGCDTVDEQG